MARFKNGFTLIEMMLGISLMMMLMLGAVYSYSSWKIKNEHDLFVANFINQLKFARGFAMQGDSVITLCPSVDHKHCDNDWHHALIIRSDQKLLRVIKHDKISVNWRSSLAANDRLVFTPLGATNGQQGSFRMSAGGKQFARIVVNRAGRVVLSSSRS